MEKTTFLRRYAEWVRKYPERAKRVEEVLRLVSFVVPSRMRGNLPLSEIAYAAVSLLGVMNESVAHPGLTRALTAPQARVRAPLKWALTSLGSMDIVMEMAAEQTSVRSILILVIELLRAAARLYLLHLSKGRMLLQGGKLAFDEQDTPEGWGAVADDPAAVTEAAACAHAVGAGAIKAGDAVELAGAGAGESSGAAPAQAAQPHAAPVEWRGRRSGRRIRVPPEWRSERVMASPSVRPPGGDGGCGPRPPANSLQWAAEVLHTLRPLLYILLRRARGRQAWSPLLLSLLTELASAQLSHAALAQRKREEGGDGAEPTRVETQELSRRRSHFAYYFLREPLFALVTEPAAERAVDTLGNVPLVGAGMRYLLDMLRYLQRYHFYTTASA